MKKLKIIVGLIFGLMVVSFVWSQLTSTDATLVVLKCIELSEGDKEKQDSGSYYKITRKFFDDRPYKVYESNPDYEEKDSSPSLLGVSFESASDQEKENLRIRRHQSPDWYTFIPAYKNGIVSSVTAIYVNRISLEMEIWTVDGNAHWETKNCSIVESRNFDDDFKSKVENKKKELKL
jgi:hypothetical protein